MSGAGPDELDRADHSNPNLQTYRRLMEAYRSEDLATLQGCLAPDVGLQAKGRNSLSGAYEGFPSVLAYIAKSMRRFVPATLRVEELTPEGDELRVVMRGLVRRPDGGTIDVGLRHTFRFDADHRIVHITAAAADDQDEFDRMIDDYFERRPT